jgi:ABC-type uncharacterized transport system YnjBCD substrate-binding protein
MMRVSKALGSWFGRGVAMAAALVALSTATDARAEEEFSAKAGKGTIEVKGNGHWHINKEAPWKATVGGTTLGKDKWELSEGVAKVSGVPAGEAKVKVYVCNGDQCKNAEVTVNVK